MSLNVTRDSTKGVYILHPEGPQGDPISPVETDNIDEVGAAIAHYFRAPRDRARHEIFKRKGLCPLCNAIENETKGEQEMKNDTQVFNHGYVAGYNQGLVDKGFKTQEEADKVMREWGKEKTLN